ncbi:MAG: ABC transporter permease, partial [Ilumatobacteraceae bacterium]
MGILKLILRRLLLGVVTLLVVSIAVFLLTNVLGDPVKRMLGRGALPDVVVAKRAELKLDRPLVTRYFSWLGGLLTG